MVKVVREVVYRSTLDDDDPGVVEYDTVEVSDPEVAQEAERLLNDVGGYITVTEAVCLAKQRLQNR